VVNSGRIVSSSLWFPALHQFEDSVSPRIDALLRRPFPAQSIALMGVVKRWDWARTALIVAECGTGKTELLF
jgi:superfamily II DNA or RNA helicase